MFRGRRCRLALYAGVGLLVTVHLLSQRRSLRGSFSAFRGTELDRMEDSEDDWFAGAALRSARSAGGGPHNCFVVEGLCHSSNRWFYRKDHGKHQPRFRLAMMSPEDEEYRHRGYLSRYNATTRLTHHETQVLGCYDDPTPNHIVLHSLYNDMLGEFYTRSLLALFVLLEEERIPVERFAARSRLYLHRAEPRKALLDSHSLFTDAFRSAPLGDLTDLLDAAPCRCLRRAAFCGYRNTTVGGDTADDDDENDAVAQNIIELVPAAISERAVFNEEDNRRTAIYARLRTFLRQQMIQKRPFVQMDIAAIRGEVLRRLLEDAPATEVAPPMSSSERKLIGLAQRSGRRRWRNLPEVLEALGPRMLAQGIEFVEVNVEDADWTPYQQLVRHAALDGLVGIHGAQLTEAVWMKPGSLVVELLPYVPHGITHGEWTTTTEEPTPLGVMFDETDLLHVGFALGRSSAPYCYDDDSLDCWKPSGNPWDERDFVVAPEAMARLLDEFVLHRPAVCGDFRNLSRPDSRTVVYNAPCAGDDAGRRWRRRPKRAAHYYWRRPSEQHMPEIAPEDTA